MYYCSIQDAWGQNYFDYDKKNSNQSISITPTKLTESHIEPTLYSKYHSIQQQQDSPEKSIISNEYQDTDEHTEEDHEEEHEEIEEQHNEEIVKEQKINNKQIQLEKKLKQKTAQLNKIKTEHKKLLQNKQNGGTKKKFLGGNNNNNHYILLGLILLFIIDYFGNLSY